MCESNIFTSGSMCFPPSYLLAHSRAESFTILSEIGISSAYLNYAYGWLQLNYFGTPVFGFF